MQALSFANETKVGASAAEQRDKKANGPTTTKQATAAKGKIGAEGRRLNTNNLNIGRLVHRLEV